MAAKCAVGAILFALCAAAGPATRPIPANLGWELGRLDTLKAAEFDRLDDVVRDNDAKPWARIAALRRIADLRVVESVRLLEWLYDGIGGMTGPWDKREITEFLGQTRMPEALAQLMIASWDPAPGPDHRWIAAEALADIQGEKALPRLREMMKDKHPTVRRNVRRQLARLSDEETVDQLIEEMRDLDNVEKVREALSGLSRGEGAKAKKAVHRLFVSVPADQGRELLELKLLAGDATLEMGNKQSVPEMIELTELTSEQLRDLTVIRTPGESLEGCTHQKFGADVEAWRCWWKEHGEQFEIFRWPRDARERLAISRAVLDWARDKQSGPYITHLPVYLDRKLHHPDLASATVRLYTPLEIELLGKQGYELAVFSSNGASATARLSKIGSPQGQKYYDVELRKSDGSWTVVNATAGHA